MTALELKKKYLRKPQIDKVHVIGFLESCVEGQPDSYFHIHSDEQIPENVGLYLKIR